jgi:hypothetical protein
MKIILLIIGLALVLTVGFYAFNDDTSQQEQSNTAGTTVDFAAYFSEELYNRATADGLIPIEGYDADLLMSEFPGLEISDFEGVESFEGIYYAQDGQLTYERTQDQPVSSAERTISAEGYATLLSNISARLNHTVTSEGDVDELVSRLAE